MTAAGAEVAKKMITDFENIITSVFSKLSRDDEDKLVAAMTTINGVLKNMEVA